MLAIYSVLLNGTTSDLFRVNCYKVLNVSSSASSDEITHKFATLKKLVAQARTPYTAVVDRLSTAAAAEEANSLLNFAFQVLSDEKSRSRFDASWNIRPAGVDNKDNNKKKQQALPPTPPLPEKKKPPQPPLAERKKSRDLPPPPPLAEKKKPQTLISPPPIAERKKPRVLPPPPQPFAEKRKRVLTVPPPPPLAEKKKPRTLISPPPIAERKKPRVLPPPPQPFAEKRKRVLTVPPPPPLAEKKKPQILETDSTTSTQLYLQCSGQRNSTQLPFLPIDESGIIKL
ncbi:hypothetical protein LINPERPRIM_LOCUS24245 [Linum perenne]